MFAANSGAPHEASFFGAFRVTFDGKLLGEAAWRRRKVGLLLKWFLLNPGDRFCGGQLRTMLWPDHCEERGVNNLHVTLHYLRRVLEPRLPARYPSVFIRSDRSGYYWFEFRDLWWTDVLEAEVLTAAALENERRGEAAKAVALYDRLIAHYEKTFLPEDVYEDLFSCHRRKYDMAYVRCLDSLMRLYLEVDQLPNALSAALRLLAVDPYSVEAVKTVVQVHLRQGNDTGAIRQIDDFLDTLGRELGLAPDTELLLLRTSILLGR